MSVSNAFSKILEKHRKPVVGMKKRVLTEQEVRWLSFFIALIVIASLTVLFVDEITLSSMIFEFECYWLTPAPYSRAALLFGATVLVLVSPRLLPLLIYAEEDKLRVRLYRAKKRYDDMYVFRMWNGEMITVHEDLVHSKVPSLYVLIGPYRAYYQGDLIIEETDEFEISKRLDFNKKLEMLEEQVSYWKTRALLSEAQLEEARRLTPSIPSGGGRSE